MDNEFKISNNPTGQELIDDIALITNTIATLSEYVARTKNILAQADDAYKQMWDEKYLMYSDSYPKANQTKIKAMVNTDDDVVRAKAVLMDAKEKSVLADSKYKSWDNRFIAVRKIASIKTTEMQTIER